MTVQNIGLEGILPIWKPAGWTSHDVVAKVRRIVRIKRIGHTGTLDPNVTGVLPLCIGRATRLVEYIQDLPKQYEAQLQLGIATDTEDLSGNVIGRLDDVRDRVSEARVREAIRQFVGEIEQMPPMYSAVKVDGKRLYELARQGKEVERKPRKVTIHQIELLDSDWTSPHPTIRFRALCSKGTYLRTLCVDIGRALGVPAVMSGLVRTLAGGIGQEQCVTLEQAEQLYAEDKLQEKLLPVEQALGHMPSVKLPPELKVKAIQGQALRLRGTQLSQSLRERTEQAVLSGTAAVSTAAGADGAAEVAAYDSDGMLIGMFIWKAGDDILLPHKIFA